MTDCACCHSPAMPLPPRQQMLERPAVMRAVRSQYFLEVTFVVDFTASKTRMLSWMVSASLTIDAVVIHNPVAPMPRPLTLPQPLVEKPAVTEDVRSQCFLAAISAVKPTASETYHLPHAYVDSTLTEHINLVPLAQL
jgi:hypothetical protein